VIKILIMVAMVVVGLIGIAKTVTRRCYPGDNIELMAFIFVVSFVLAMSGAVCLGVAFASY
jgi:hypothetical protein